MSIHVTEFFESSTFKFVTNFLKTYEILPLFCLNFKIHEKISNLNFWRKRFISLYDVCPVDFEENWKEYSVKVERVEKCIENDECRVKILESHVSAIESCEICNFFGRDFILTGDCDGILNEWDVLTGECVFQTKFDSSIKALFQIGQLPAIVVVTTYKIYRMKMDVIPKPTIVFETSLEIDEISRPCFHSPYLFLSGGNEIYVYSMDNGELLCECDDFHEFSISEMKFWEGKMFMISDSCPKIRVFKYYGVLEELSPITVCRNPIKCIEFNKDELGIGDYGGGVTIFKICNTEFVPIEKFQDHSRGVKVLSFNNKFIVSGSFDNSIIIRDRNGSRKIVVQKKVQTLKIFKSKIIIGGFSGDIIVKCLRSGSEHVIHQCLNPVSQVKFPDNAFPTYFFCASLDSTAILSNYGDWTWDFVGKEIRKRDIESCAEEKITSNYNWDCEEWKLMYKTNPSMQPFLRNVCMKNTVSIVRKGNYVANDVTIKLDKEELEMSSFQTTKFSASQKLPEVEKRFKRTKVHLFRKDWIDIIQFFSEKKVKSSDICILNFANKDKPNCLSFRYSSQEENLHYRSNLFQSLDDLDGVDVDRKWSYPIDEFGGAILSKKVFFLRKGIENGFELLESPVEVGVITMPAIAFPEVKKVENDEGDIEVRLKTPNRLKLLNMMKRMFTICSCSGFTTLILGDWGAGCFKNPPLSVAECFRDTIEEFEGVFQNVSFAVFYNDINFRAFKKCFDQ